MATEHWTEKTTWEHISGIIFKDLGTGKFHFSDEAEQLDETPYGTAELAEQAATEYSKTL